MGKKQKQLKRLERMPRDFTFDEACSLKELLSELKEVCFYE